MWRRRSPASQSCGQSTGLAACASIWRLCRRMDVAPAFGGEPDVFDVFKAMLGETGKRFNNPLRALWNTGVRTACLVLRECL